MWPGPGGVAQQEKNTPQNDGTSKGSSSEEMNAGGFAPERNLTLPALTGLLRRWHSQSQLQTMATATVVMLKRVGRQRLKVGVRHSANRTGFHIRLVRYTYDTWVQLCAYDVLYTSSSTVAAWYV